MAVVGGSAPQALGRWWPGPWGPRPGAHGSGHMGTRYCSSSKQTPVRLVGMGVGEAQAPMLVKIFLEQSFMSLL